MPSLAFSPALLRPPPPPERSWRKSCPSDEPSSVSVGGAARSPLPSLLCVASLCSKRADAVFKQTSGYPPHPYCTVGICWHAVQGIWALTLDKVDAAVHTWEQGEREREEEPAREPAGGEAERARSDDLLLLLLLLLLWRGLGSADLRPCARQTHTPRALR